MQTEATVANTTPPPPIFFSTAPPQTVDVGTHRIIFNRVAPPPPRPAQMSVAPLASAADEEGEDHRFLSLSATVYDGRFTELRGTDARGSWRAWSNVDFNLLASVNEFGTTSTTYSLCLALDSDTADSLVQAGLHPPNLSSSLPAGRAAYLFADGATAAGHPEAVAALDALHRFHDAYRPQLLQAFQQHQADQAAQVARAEQERLHPAPPPDTTINFWPKQGSVLLGH